MSSFPLIVSYFTQDALYAPAAEALRASCERFALPCDIEAVDSFGNWELNCAFKPFFLYRKLKEHKRPLLWVDADALFVRAPQKLRAFAADIAVRTFPELPDDHASKVLSGSLYINYSEKAAHFLKEWAKLCQQELTDPKRTLEFWDQTALRDALQSTDVRVAHLPARYAFIADHPEDQRTIADPVIAHFQASRYARRILY